jgi:hypothetical protein
LPSVEGKRERKRVLYWVTGVGILISWPIGAAIGGMLGGVIPEPAALGVDAVLPAVLVAIAYPAMKDRWTAGVVMVGAVLAIAATPVVPVRSGSRGGVGSLAACAVEEEGVDLTHESLIVGIAAHTCTRPESRMSGTLLGAKREFSEETEKVLGVGTTTLLVAVAVTASLFDGNSVGGWARALGVLAALVATVFACRSSVL